MAHLRRPRSSRCARRAAATSLDSLIPRVVGARRAHRGRRADLGLSMSSSARSLGPAFGGVLVATVGVGWPTASTSSTSSFVAGLLGRMRAVPPQRMRTAPSIAASSRGSVRLVPQGSAGHLRGRPVRDVLRLPLRPLPVRRGRPATPRGRWDCCNRAGFVGRAVATVTSADGPARAPPRPRDRLRRCCLGSSYRGLRARPRHLVGAVLMLAFAGGGDMVSGIFRQPHVEPDDPGRDTWSDGRDRAARRTPGTDIRSGPLESRRTVDVAAQSVVSGGSLRRRCFRARGRIAFAMDVRRTNRRERRATNTIARAPSGRDRDE